MNKLVRELEFKPIQPIPFDDLCSSEKLLDESATIARYTQSDRVPNIIIPKLWSPGFTPRDNQDEARDFSKYAIMFTIFIYFLLEKSHGSGGISLAAVTPRSQARMVRATTTTNRRGGLLAGQQGRPQM